MLNTELESIVNKKLQTNNFQDYIPNGLQVEGRKEIKTILTGVSACQQLLCQAVNTGVDAIIVHHGYFWRSDSPVITGIRYNRLKILLTNDINLFSWHLPLDMHKSLGNNIQLGKTLGINVLGEIKPLLLWGELPKPIDKSEFSCMISTALSRKPLHIFDNASEKIYKIAWCTGNGQHFIEDAAIFGVDTFISGEISEQTVHIAREYGLHLFAAGHYATECGGIKALGRWLSTEYGLSTSFYDINNPV